MIMVEFKLYSILPSLVLSPSLLIVILTWIWPCVFQYCMRLMLFMMVTNCVCMCARVWCARVIEVCEGKRKSGNTRSTILQPPPGLFRPLGFFSCLVRVPRFARNDYVHCTSLSKTCLGQLSQSWSRLTLSLCSKTACIKEICACTRQEGFLRGDGIPNVRQQEF